ncbi:MAG: lipid II flippase MurJ [Gaiellaceae bacterium]
MTRYTSRSATYIGSITLAAKLAERLAAFVQIALIASIFGATTRSDLYFIASIIPLTAGTVVGEALATSMLPSLVRRHRSHGFQSYLAATFWLSLGVLSALLVVYVAIAAVVVADLSPAGTTSLWPWLAFCPILLVLGMSSYFSSVLLVQERYTWPPFRAAVATTSGLILVGISLLVTHSVTLIAACTTAGYSIALGLLFVDVARAYGLSWMRKPTRDDVRAVLALRRNIWTGVAGGVVGGQTFVLVERALAAGLGVGAVSTISYARGIVFTPNLVGQAVAMGIYPGMVRAHEANDAAFVRAALIRGLRLTLVVGLAVVVYLAAFSKDLVHLLLQRGALDAGESAVVGRSLLAFAPAVLGSALLILSSRLFYAVDYFRGIVWSQLAVLVIYVPLALALRSWEAPVGLAAAFGIAELAGGIASVALAARIAQTSWTDLRPLAEVARPVALVALVVLPVTLGLDQLHASGAAQALVGGAATVLTVTAYLLTSNWPEAAVLRRFLRREAEGR